MFDPVNTVISVLIVMLTLITAFIGYYITLYIRCNNTRREIRRKLPFIKDQILKIAYLYAKKELKEEFANLVFNKSLTIKELRGFVEYGCPNIYKFLLRESIIILSWIIYVLLLILFNTYQGNQEDYLSFFPYLLLVTILMGAIILCSIIIDNIKPLSKRIEDIEDIFDEISVFVEKKMKEISISEHTSP